MVASNNGVHSSTGVTQAFVANSGNLTFAITVPANTTEAAICVALGTTGSSQSVDSVTVNGVAATALMAQLMTDSSTDGSLRVFRIANPTSGNVVINYSGVQVSGSLFGIMANVAYYAGADPCTGPVTAQGTAAPFTVSKSSAVGSLSGAFYADGAAMAAGTWSHTKRFGIDFNNASAGGNMSYQEMAGTGSSVAMTLTGVNDWWAGVAWEIPAAAAVGPPLGLVLEQDGFLELETGVRLLLE
jgi:hypothetical protein